MTDRMPVQDALKAHPVMALVFALLLSGTGFGAGALVPAVPDAGIAVLTTQLVSIEDRLTALERVEREDIRELREDIRDLRALVLQLTRD